MHLASGPLVVLSLAAACLLGTSAAQAAPEAQDPMSLLLAERGLLPSAAAGPAPPPTLAQQVRDGASDMVLSAMNFLGVPYRRGGSSEETGFDCSGFTRHIFELSLGLVLPRRADEQASAPGLFSISKGELKPGDLVFFNTMRRTFSHVGIYIGDGKFVHAPRTGSSVRVEDMRMAYWQQRFTGARRVDSAALGTAPVKPREVTPLSASPSRSAAVGPAAAPQGQLAVPVVRALDSTPLLP